MGVAFRTRDMAVCETACRAAVRDLPSEGSCGDGDGEEVEDDGEEEGVGRVTG